MKHVTEERGWGLGSENNLGQKTHLGSLDQPLPNAMPAVRLLHTNAASFCLQMAQLKSGGVAFLGCQTADFEDLLRKALGLQDPSSRKPCLSPSC